MTLHNEPISALTHMIGVFLSIAALVLLIITARAKGDGTSVTAYTVFGTTMIFLYTMSTIFHFICSTKKRIKRIFRIFDHIGIYLLIAGTYTPIALVVLPTVWGWSIFGSIWGLALIGILIESLQCKYIRYISPTLYLVMGWLILVCLDSIREIFSNDAFFWLVSGGVAYTIGVVFYTLDTYIPRTKWFGMHEVFHICVLLGSFSHFWLLYRYIL